MSRSDHSQSTARRRDARRSGFVLCGLLALLVAAPSFAAEIVEIRVGRHPTFSRVVFELDRAAGYRVERREQGGKEELVVTLDASSRGRSISSRSEAVSRVEVQRDRGRSVAHIDVRKPGLQLKEMILANPPRIVLDLMLEQPPAPKVAKKEPAPAPKVAKKQPEPAPAPEKPTPKPAPKVVKKEPAPAPKVAKEQPEPAPAPEEPAPKPAPKVVKKEPAPAPKLAKKPLAPTPEAAKKEPEPAPEQIAKGEPHAIMPPLDEPAPEAEPEPAEETRSEADAIAERMAKKSAPRPILPPLDEPEPEAETETSKADAPDRLAKAEKPETPAGSKAGAPEPPKAGKPGGAPVVRKPEAVKPKATTPPAGGASDSDGTDWLAGLPSSPVLLGAAAGVLFCLVGLVLLVLRRRRGPGALDVTTIAAGAPEDRDADAGSLFGDSEKQPATSLSDFFKDDGGAKDTLPTPPEPRGVQRDARPTPPEPKGAQAATPPQPKAAQPQASSETSFEGLFDDTDDDSDAAPQTGAAAMGDTSMSQMTSDLPADRTARAASAPQAAGGDKDLLRVVHELERRMSQLEGKLQESNEARERLERQVAAQSEELRVQRAAIARTQRALRTMSRGDEDKATEPALRDADTQAKTRTVK